MIYVRFVQPDNSDQIVELHLGQTVMEGAVGAGVEGIDADCGGALACATCHVHVAPEWVSVVGPPGVDEREMLEVAFEPTETSRLCCQIAVTGELAGLVLHVPKTQR